MASHQNGAALAPLALPSFLYCPCEPLGKGADGQAAAFSACTELGLQQTMGMEPACARSSGGPTLGPHWAPPPCHDSDLNFFKFNDFNSSVNINSTLKLEGVADTACVTGSRAASESLRVLCHTVGDLAR